MGTGKLVEKDEAARQGVGDPAVFLNEGDAEDEEARVAEFIAEGKGADALEQFMDNNLATAAQHHEEMDDFDLLFGDYQRHQQYLNNSHRRTRAPRLYPDTFTYTSRMLRRLGDPSLGLFNVSLTSRMKIAIFALSCPMICEQRTR